MGISYGVFESLIARFETATVTKMNLTPSRTFSVPRYTLGDRWIVQQSAMPDIPGDAEGYKNALSIRTTGCRVIFEWE